MKGPASKALWKYDLALVAAIAALYHEVIFGSAQIIGRDVLHYLVPIGAALREGYLGRGSVLWDGTVDHGLPVVARWSPMVFYPGQWLNALLGPLTAVSVGILLHLVLAGCATMRLALRYTPSPAAAWLGGFSFAAGGYLISVSVGGGYLAGAALLPLSLLAFHRLAERPTVPRSVQVTAVMTAQILCADPQTLLYEGVFLVPLVLWFHHREGSTAWLRFRMAGLAAALAVGAGACQWVPAVEFMSLSSRARGLGLEAQDVWAFHPLRIVQFLSPHILGAVTPDQTFWARSLVNANISIPWAPYLYSGLLPWAGVLSINWRRPPQRLLAVGLLTLALLVLSFGPFTPVYHLVLTALPGAKYFRYPEKFLVFVCLGLCILGAAGGGRLLEDLTSADASARRRRLRTGAAFGAIAIAGIVLRVWLDPSSAARLEWFTQVLAAQRATVGPALALTMTASSVVHTAVVAAVVAALCLAAPRLSPALVVLAGAAIAAGDLLPASLTQRYLADGQLFAQTPAVCAEVPADGSGVPPMIWRYDAQMIHVDPVNERLDGTRFERQRFWEWQTLMANTGANYCVRHAAGYEAAQLQRYRLLWLGMKENLDRRLRVFGVRYIVAGRDSIDSAHFPLASTSEALHTTISRVPDPLPYAHTVGAAVQVPDLDAAIGRLADDSFDFYRAIVLERPGRDFQAAARQVKVATYRAGEILLDIDFAAPGYLLLQETWYPGWRAELDAGPLAVERANATFLGAELPAGSHRVRFVFDPPLQRAANRVSAIFVLITAASLAAATWRGRRRSAPRVA